MLPILHPARAARAALGVAALALACSSGQPPAPPPPGVKVVDMVARPAVAQEEYVARLEASNTVEIRPQVEGLLKEQSAVEGQRVEAGQLLFLIDPDPFVAALAHAQAEKAQAEARLAQAKRDLERVQRLFDSNVASQQALDAAVAQERAAQATVRAGEAGIDTAQLRLGYTRVTSPIAGVVGRAEVRIGAAVQAFDTLLTRVYANDPMYVDFSISEQRMLQMQHDFGPDLAKSAQGFRIVLADGSDYPHAGRLDFVDQALDEKTATLPMRLVVPNPDGLLRANQFARVVVPVESIPDALVVPVRAVQDFQGMHSVWIVDAQGLAQTRDVVLGPRLDGEWIVKSGLAPGDHVVVDGVQKLRPGVAVSTEPSGPANVAAEPGSAPNGS